MICASLKADISWFPFKPTKKVKDFVLEYLSEGCPMTRKQLMNCIESKSERREFKMSSISPMLSELVKNNVVKKFIIYNNGIHNKFYYCLPQWFDGKELKEKYFRRIKIK